jgi:hypothetical protein
MFGPIANFWCAPWRLRISNTPALFQRETSTGYRVHISITRLFHMPQSIHVGIIHLNTIHSCQKGFSSLNEVIFPEYPGIRSHSTPMNHIATLVASITSTPNLSVVDLQSIITQQNRAHNVAMGRRQALRAIRQGCP